MKRPSFQFYPGDWRSNANLRRCTHAERGIWMDLLCLMHDGEQYGVLRWPLKEIAQAVGCKTSELRGLVTKGVLKGADQGETVEAFVYTPRHGGQDGEPVTLIHRQQGPVWYSSRMLTDEHIRTRRGAWTRIDSDGNLPPKRSPKATPMPAPKPPFGGGLGGGLGDGPSSSSSSSSSNTGDDDDSVTTDAREDAPSVVDPPPMDGPEPLDFTGDPPPLDPIHLRAVELTALGRLAGAAYHASDPRVRAWAERGVSDGQLMTAIEQAHEQRHEAGSAQPVGAGYLDSILSENRNGAPQHGNRRFSPSQWVAERLAAGVGDAPARPVVGDVRDAVSQLVRRTGSDG